MAIPMLSNQKNVKESVTLTIDESIVNSIIGTIPKGDDQWNWEAITKELFHWDSDKAKKVRKPARDYCEKHLITLKEWKDIQEGSEEDSKRKGLEYYKKNEDKFFKTGNLRWGLVAEGSTKGAVILINLPKLMAEVEQSKGEKVRS